MLVIEQIKYFFCKNSIELQEEKILPLDDVGTLLLDADLLGRSFAGFVLNTILNSKRDGIQTNFSSWDELYECYVHFMIGYNGAGVN